MKSGEFKSVIKYVEFTKEVFGRLSIITAKGTVGVEQQTPLVFTRIFAGGVRIPRQSRGL
jgi:hypothetical protein